MLQVRRSAAAVSSVSQRHHFDRAVALSHVPDRSALALVGKQYRHVNCSLDHPAEVGCCRTLYSVLWARRGVRCRTLFAMVGALGRLPRTFPRQNLHPPVLTPRSGSMPVAHIQRARTPRQLLFLLKLAACRLEVLGTKSSRSDKADFDLESSDRFSRGLACQGRQAGFLNSLF
jgi:hypothetical protein